MKKFKVDGMILATFLSTVFYASTFPYIHKQIMMEVANTTIAFQSIILDVSIIITGAIWNRWSNKLFKFYPLMCVAETIGNIATTIWVLATGNLAAYYIIDAIVFGVITRNMICGGNKLRILRYVDEADREHFQNNNNSASSAATIIGSIIALKLNLSFPLMLCLATIGNCIDNIFYFAIYYSTTKKRA